MALRTLRSTKQYGHRVRRNQRVTEALPVLIYDGTPGIDTKNWKFGGSGTAGGDPRTRSIVPNP